MTGTSMATPHVAGGAALFYLYEQAQGHGRPTTREVRAALRKTGVINWRTATDKDSTHEPLLDVSSFAMSPDFEVSSTPQVRLAGGGDSPSFDIWLARLGGFGGGVNVSVVGSTLPNGANANVDENAPNLPNGAVARVTINLPGIGNSGHVRHHGSWNGRRHDALNDCAGDRRARGQRRAGHGHPRAEDERLRDPDARQLAGRWR